MQNGILINTENLWVAFQLGYLNALCTKNFAEFIPDEYSKSPLQSFLEQHDIILTTDPTKAIEEYQEFSVPSSTTPQRYFPVRHNEFGETYHIATAMHLDSSTGADLSEANWQQIIFFMTAFPNRCSKTLKEQLPLDHTAEIISKYFKSNSNGRAILTTMINGQYGDHKIWPALISYIEKKLNIQKEGLKIALWIRRKNNNDSRDLHPDALMELVNLLKSMVDPKECHIILFGDPITLGEQNAITALNFRLILLNKGYYNTDEFRKVTGLNPILGQWALQYVLHKQYNLSLAMGMKSGAMDGAAFLGLPTCFFSAGGSRMTRVCETVSSLHMVTYNHEEYCKNSKFGDESLDALRELCAQLLPPQAVSTTPFQSITNGHSNAKDVVLQGKGFAV